MLQLDIFIILAQLINFGILYAIFKYTIADKLSAKLDERAAQLEKLKRADEHYEEKMQLAETQRDEMMQEAKKTSRNLMNESEFLANAKADVIKAKAKAEALAILDGGKRDLAKERLSMLSQVKKHIIDVSLRLNEKMF
jgi:F0F1-type ATP synthase membrane subunit b/b'